MPSAISTASTRPAAGSACRLPSANSPKAAPAPPPPARTRKPPRFSPPCRTARCSSRSTRRGKNLDSRAFAGRIARWRDDGTAELVFAIGGADGLGPALLGRAVLRLALRRHDLAASARPPDARRTDLSRRDHPLRPPLSSRLKRVPRSAAARAPKTAVLVDKSLVGCRPSLVPVRRPDGDSVLRNAIAPCHDLARDRARLRAGGGAAGRATAATAGQRDARQAELDAVTRDITLSAQRRAELRQGNRLPRQGPRHPQPVADRRRQSGPEARGGERPDRTAPRRADEPRGPPARLAGRAPRRARRGSGRPAAHGPPPAAGHPGATRRCAGLGAERHSARRRGSRPAAGRRQASPPTCTRWLRCARSRSASATACAPTPRRCSKGARAYHFFLSRSAPPAPPRPRRWPTRRSGPRPSPTRRPACTT